MSKELMTTIKHKTITGFFWLLVQKLFSQGVHFLITIVLARILLPEDFGLVAMTAIFMKIAGIFVVSGLGVSLVQKKESDELDYNTVFYASLGFAIVLYTTLFFTAPWIARIYNNALIIDIIRILGLTLFPSAFSTVQNAAVMRKMDYRKFFYVSLISVFHSCFS